MSFRRVAVPLLIVAGVVAACSGDDGGVAGAIDAGSRGSSSGRAASSASSSGILDPQPGGSTSSSSGGVVDLGSLITLTISSDSCTKSGTQCFDAQSFTIDFLSSTLTNTTCVERAGDRDSGGGGVEDAKTSKTMTKDQLDTIRKLVAKLKTSNEGVSDAGPPNGTVHSLSVTTKSQGSTYYLTSDTRCSKRDDAVALVSGWTELWDAIRTM